MVEISDLSIVIAAISVSLAAFYYIFNMRHAIRTREMDACRYLTQFTTSERTNQSFAIISRLEWKDPEDFYKKYWYSNPEMFGRINSWFFVAENLGILVKHKIASAETIYDMGGWVFIHQWDKYSACINWRRELPRQTMGREYMKNFEFLAQELEKVGQRRDPNFRNRLEGYRKNLKS